MFIKERCRPQRLYEDFKKLRDAGRWDLKLVNKSINKELLVWQIFPTVV